MLNKLFGKLIRVHVLLNSEPLNHLSPFGMKTKTTIEITICGIGFFGVCIGSDRKMYWIKFDILCLSIISNFTLIKDYMFSSCRNTCYRSLQWILLKYIAESSRWASNVEFRKRGKLRTLL
ncbi:hypothetical protein BpHYR1_047074 [Brachionus plicatilis]|uniref:Uncharacterized protein n=1 Tax=Brachionus plicatilis TaxID=10195 RepID=A0A3M7QV23_BRAPC|nr:hypothetical protein BpHYR1_047074 [Brachionus plicatilis]